MHYHVNHRIKWCLIYSNLTGLDDNTIFFKFLYHEIELIKSNTQIQKWLHLIPSIGHGKADFLTLQEAQFIHANSGATQEFQFIHANLKATSQEFQHHRCRNHVHNKFSFHSLRNQDKDMSTTKYLNDFPQSFQMKICYE